MKIDLNTNLLPIFTGTYESIWEVCEYNDNGEELPVDYKHKELMASIAREYQDHAEFIVDELGIDFIKSIKFSGGFYSPREYNFSTDTLDFTLEVNKSKMLKKLNELSSDSEFEKYLHDHYTSYDGFMSFTPNNYNDLKNEIVNEGNEYSQSIGAFLTYLAKNNKMIDYDYYNSIEGSIHEDWQGNGYNGLDYQVCEHKLTDWSCKQKKCFNYYSG